MGTFNDLSVFYSSILNGPTIPMEIERAGVYWSISNGGIEPMAWKDGQVYFIQEAFDLGLVPHEDLVAASSGGCLFDCDICQRVTRIFTEEE